MKENVARRPRFRRVSDDAPLRLTRRDKAILATVSRYRFLTTSLILSLVPGSRQNVTRRLQRLYHAGFLDRPRAQLALRYAGDLSEIIYCPSPKIDKERGYKPTTSLFLSHALLVSEVLIRIESDCHAQGARFIPEHKIHSPTVCRRMQWCVAVKVGTSKEEFGVIPDAAFAIEWTSGGAIRRHYFFVEADRGTMPIYRKSLRLSSIRRKALAYARSRAGRLLKDRFGIPGFQVLFITPSKERLVGIKQVCREVTDGRDSSLFLFATVNELRSSSPLELIYPHPPVYQGSWKI